MLLGDLHPRAADRRARGCGRHHGAVPQLVVFNSLSKRSNLPGLRSGFCAGDGDFIEMLAEVRNVIGCQMPGPVQHASAAVWSEEQHVTTIRQAYRVKYDICDEVLGTPFRLHAGRRAASSFGSTCHKSAAAWTRP